MKNIMIVGATSAIAGACARRWAQHGARFFLAGRRSERLDQVAADLVARGATLATVFELDIDVIARHATMLESCMAQLGSPDIVLIAAGTLPDQTACEADAALAYREFTTNAAAIVALLTSIATLLEAQRHGVLAVISSVAGDRGRPSNYLYGSAKAALSVFCEGLHARLFKAGVHVITIKPGFVATPMTAALKLPALLVATADEVAADIVRAIEKQRAVLYTPRFWSSVMLIIRCIPRFVFKRLAL